ncbi:MAG: diaminopimelate epimerase, partial [Gemmatimonadota bacterium]
SACAVAAAAVRRQLVVPGSVTIHMPGGSLNVTVSEDYEIEMVGPAQLVYEAEIINELTT